MVVGYRDKRTRDFATGKRVKAFSGIERPARLRLDRLEAAIALKDLAVLPGNRFEALAGDRKGQYSIRINDTIGGSVLNGQMERRGRQTWRSLTIIRRTLWQ